MLMLYSVCVHVSFFREYNVNYVKLAKMYTNVSVAVDIVPVMTNVLKTRLSMSNKAR